MAKIKKGDTVQVIAGKDEGKKGKVLKVFPKENKILIEGVNIRSKNQRAKKGGQKGEIIKIVKPIAVSSAMIFCSHCGRVSRIGFYVAPDGIKRRICKRCKQEI